MKNTNWFLNQAFLLSHENAVARFVFCFASLSRHTSLAKDAPASRGKRRRRVPDVGDQSASLAKASALRACARFAFRSLGFVSSTRFGRSSVPTYTRGHVALQNTLDRHSPRHASKTTLKKPTRIANHACRWALCARGVGCEAERVREVEHEPMRKRQIPASKFNTEIVQIGS